MSRVYLNRPFGLGEIGCFTVRWTDPDRTRLRPSLSEATVSKKQKHTWIWDDLGNAPRKILDHVGQI